MANALYAAAQEKFLTAAMGDLTSVTVTVSLMDNADYTVNLAADDFEDDLTAAGQVADAVVGVTSAVNGELDAPNTTFSAVTGDVCESIVTWVNTGGAPTTDPLIGYYDTFSAGMPVTPNGGDIIVAWPSGIVMTIKANDA